MRKKHIYNYSWRFQIPLKTTKQQLKKDGKELDTMNKQDLISIQRTIFTDHCL